MRVVGWLSIQEKLYAHTLAWVRTPASVLDRLGSAGRGEPLGQHQQVVGKHGTVHIRLEVLKPFPVAA